MILFFPKAKLPSYAPPAVLSSAIAEEQKKLNSTAEPIMNKPKPKPPKVEPPPDTKNDENKMDSNPVNGEGEVGWEGGRMENVSWLVRLKRPE